MMGVLTKIILSLWTIETFILLGYGISEIVHDFENCPVSNFFKKALWIFGVALAVSILIFLLIDVWV